MLKTINKAFFSHAYQQYLAKDVPILFDQQKSLEAQQECLHTLVEQAKSTNFGKEHAFREIAHLQKFDQQYTFFQDHVPISDYEMLQAYIAHIKKWAENILRKWETKYLSTTSGTVSGKKYIPITPASMKDQMDIGKNAIAACFGQLDPKPQMWKMFFLSWSPKLSTEGSVIPHGRLSWIVHNETPALISAFAKSPTYKTNCIEDFGAKIDAITNEHLKVPKQLTMIAGIPSYLKDYIEAMLAKWNKATLKELLPNLSMLVIWGVNPAPYKAELMRLLGDPTLPCVETYPASEGFIAYQDTHYPLNEQHNGMLLQTHKGIFFEFIPLEDYAHGELTPQHRRLWLGEIEIGKPYALILNTNAGLRWYEIGDVVTFTSLNPYRIKFSGRTWNFISAFGEHVIEPEIQSLAEIAKQHGVLIEEYTVAPHTQDKQYHERFVELSGNTLPIGEQLSAACHAMDAALQQKNEYYRDLRKAWTLLPLQIRILKPWSCSKYMQAQPGFDPQKKLPHLRDDRKIVEWFEENSLVG